MVEGGGWGVMVCADAADKDTSLCLQLALLWTYTICDIQHCKNANLSLRDCPGITKW